MLWQVQFPSQAQQGAEGHKANGLNQLLQTAHFLLVIPVAAVPDRSMAA